MKKNIIAALAVLCAIVCMGAYFHGEYEESAKTIDSLQNQISQVKNDWDIYNYKGEAVTGAYLRLHLQFEIQDSERNFGYWLFK